MKTHQPASTSKTRDSGTSIPRQTIKTLGYTALLTLSLTLGMHYAQAASLQNNPIYGFQESQSEYERLDAALAPIALYPDTLLTHIFIASTYPLEVIEAARFIQQHDKFDVDDYERNGLDQATIEAIQEDALDFGWDASVIALTAFPDILNNMSDDLGWLSDLGEAFENDQERVLQRVQHLRDLAYNQGNLQNDEQIEVVVEREQQQQVIVIQPRRHDVVYVPYYDVASIYGPSWSVSYSYRWSRPYYARHYRHRHVYFSPAAYIGTRLLFGGIHWSHRYVSINRDWSYRKARHYHYNNPRHKRVYHKEYQRWTPKARHTRHVERKKYAGVKKVHRSFGKSKWVTNKHSEFAKVKSKHRYVGDKTKTLRHNKQNVLRKPINKTRKNGNYKTQPYKNTQKQRNFKSEKQVNNNKRSNDVYKRTPIKKSNTIKRTPIQKSSEKRTSVQRSTIQRSAPKQVQRQTQKRSAPKSKSSNRSNRPTQQKRNNSKSHKR